MSQSSSQNGKESTGLDNTTYNLITALQKEADFLYSTVDTYISDARRENRANAEQVWTKLKETKMANVQMLKDALASEAEAGKVGQSR
jgi:hypothetical protein